MNDKDLKPVRISDFHYSSNYYKNGDYKYRVKDLIEVSKNIEPFDLPLQGIDLSYSPWGDIKMADFVFHSKRIKKANLKYPIILSDRGVICDGWHRILKAILRGDKSIKAVRLEVMPDCM